MSMPNTAALLAAVEPIAAYVARTPPSNQHADRCATLVDAVADYVEAVEMEAEACAAEPDWKTIALRIMDALDFSPPTNRLLLRCQRLLDRPHLKKRAAQPLAPRLYLAQFTSHHLGLPDYLK